MLLVEVHEASVNTRAWVTPPGRIDAGSLFRVLKSSGDLGKHSGHNKGNRWSLLTSFTELSRDEIFVIPG